MIHEQQAARPDRQQAISALRHLTPTQHDAIVLAIYGGQTYKEVAATLRRSEDEVKAALRNGLGRMRARLLAADPGIAAV
ncbi:hypothetical protein KSP35_16660 [Aquihabitans sp. G128]|uniref:sigma factor-like helix-turn-helix DNA-binding protein n=1 Tax=Aquihabitans sp. G128 TaxID=2849779 RepID=UPI001C211A10|nr:sigma factor-like helix-turn-helix DNA-binding protein [Aquihabitans sp. G128]QXC59989.1 hypothetical protein KSP35_16660 [Aquihabitans sp. G128]